MSFFHALHSNTAHFEPFLKLLRITTKALVSESVLVHGFSSIDVRSDRTDITYASRYLILDIVIHFATKET
jgi:hypothetical protein